MLTEKESQAIADAGVALENQPTRATVIIRRRTLVELQRLAKQAAANKDAANYMEKKLRQCGEDLESAMWKSAATGVVLACVSALLLIVLVMS